MSFQSWLSVIFLVLLAFAGSNAQVTVVDVVPATFSTEAEQNSEPNLAVNPLNPQEILISAFGPTRKNPIYFSKDGGFTWSVFQQIGTSDTSLAWSDSGAAYLSKLSEDGNALFAAKSRDPQVRQFGYFPGSLYAPGRGGPDQPWVFANKIGTVDHIYVAFNDLSRRPRTASIRYSLNGGALWHNVQLERVVPGDGADDAAVRVAANGATVYAVFERNNQTVDQAGDEEGDIVVMKDLRGGSNRFTDLGVKGVGIVAAAGEIFPQGSLGNERLGSDLSIAIDPGDPNRVFVAYARLINDAPEVRVIVSTDGGVNWTEAFRTAASSAMPALAVAANGSAGLLWTRFLNGNLETHFVRSGNSFATALEQTLSRFTDGSPVPDFDPYIGDYEDLQAVGNTFYGAFSASNDTRLFPAGVTVSFLRDTTQLGRSTPYSIDPFFFSEAALP